MSCSATLAGLAQDCAASMGGVKKILIRPWAPGLFTEQVGDENKVHVASLTISTTVWKAYYFRNGNANVNTQLTIDNQNGVNFCTTTLELTATRQETVKREEFSALQSSEVAVVYQDMNGIWWALGIDGPVTAESGEAQSGANKTDGNFYKINLVTESATFPIELNSYSSTIANKIQYPT